MSGRWYSLTIHSSQLQSLRTALARPVADPDAREALEALQRQLQRHIHNEKTITEWERDFDE
jgi:hypothetical protein